MDVESLGIAMMLFALLLSLGAVAGTYVPRAEAAAVAVTGQVPAGRIKCRPPTATELAILVVSLEHLVIATLHYIRSTHGQ